MIRLLSHPYPFAFAGLAGDRRMTCAQPTNRQHQPVDPELAPGAPRP